MAVAATLTAIVIGGKDAPAARTSLRVHVTVVVPLQVQPLPVALVVVSPAGRASVTVVVLPSVGVASGSKTVSVSVPVWPGRNTAGLCVAVSFNGCGTMKNGAGGVPA